MVQRIAAAAGAIAVSLTVTIAAPTPAGSPIRLVVLGDSLVAGFGLPASEAFPAQLERALKAKGHAVEITNAGVSGDTATGGLARLDWSIPDGTDAVIVTLGANDMLRGIDPKVTQDALDGIVRRLRARNIEVLLTGMRAAPNLGPDYGRRFDAIYPQVATAQGVLFYPFFLDGVAADAKLNQHDGIHPNAVGVAAIVERLLPKVEELLRRVQARRSS